jgi:hypothetical protein
LPEKSNFKVFFGTASFSKRMIVETEKHIQAKISSPEYVNVIKPQPC